MSSKLINYFYYTTVLFSCLGNLKYKVLSFILVLDLLLIRLFQKRFHPCFSIEIFNMGKKLDIGLILLLAQFLCLWINLFHNSSELYLSLILVLIEGAVFKLLLVVYEGFLVRVCDQKWFICHSEVLEIASQRLHRV